jgi:hypothetical protein
MHVNDVPLVEYLERRGNSNTEFTITVNDPNHRLEEHGLGVIRVTYKDGSFIFVRWRYASIPLELLNLVAADINQLDVNVTDIYSLGTNRRVTQSFSVSRMLGPFSVNSVRTWSLLTSYQDYTLYERYHGNITEYMFEVRQPNEPGREGSVVRVILPQQITRGFENRDTGWPLSARQFQITIIRIEHDGIIYPIGVRIVERYIGQTNPYDRQEFTHRSLYIMFGVNRPEDSKQIQEEIKGYTRTAYDIPVEGGRFRLFLYELPRNLIPTYQVPNFMEMLAWSNYGFASTKVSAEESSSSGFHTVGIRLNDGSVYCYGLNYKNICDSLGERFISALNPVYIHVLDNNVQVPIKTVLATKHGSFFLSQAGDVYAIGDNGESGQKYLGLAPDGIITIPTKLALPAKVVAFNDAYNNNLSNYPDMVTLNTVDKRIIAFGLGLIAGNKIGSNPVFVTLENDEVASLQNTAKASCYFAIDRLSKIKRLKCFREPSSVIAGAPAGYFSYNSPYVDPLTY